MSLNQVKQEVSNNLQQLMDDKHVTFAKVFQHLMGAKEIANCRIQDVYKAANEICAMIESRGESLVANICSQPSSAIEMIKTHERELWQQIIARLKQIGGYRDGPKAST